ncbi:MAG: signal peptide peptidase SppA [Prolixibacteraceae bacterium]|jgi:protease-4|nr:signal peptide peptidase SppA [Prolixibacteraceae bacterium]
MKGFLKYTLATVVGIIIVTVLSMLIMGGIISAVMSSSKKEVVIKDKSMLQLKLASPVVDRAPNDPFQDLNIPGFDSYKKIGLNDITSAIEKAKDEDKIKGIYLRLDNLAAGYAASEEIRNALLDFKTSGKFIYAYSESYSQKAYYLASAADKVFINPEGMLMFTGLASQPLFFKNALEKLGVEMQIIRHGKFKAAVEPFMLEKMSPENRKQTEVYMGSIWENLLEGISESRGISVDQLNEIANENLLFRNVDLAQQYQMVDSVLYEDQVLDFLRGETGIKPDKGIPVVSVSDMKQVPAKRKGKGLAKDKIAIIYASGDINVGGSPDDGEAISGRHIAREIREIRTDSTIKAVVLRVNSPGGSALGSDLIWREVKLLAEQKPTVVSMGNLAASGGYYIACAADTIVSNPSTITGSIGVFGVIPNFQNLLEDKLGINHDIVKTNSLSDMPSTNRALTKTERALMQNMVEETYATFVNHVAEGRGLSFEQVDAIGQGRVWTGENALELGLVDVLGDLNDAIDIAAEMAELDNYRISNYPKQKDPLESLLKDLSSKVKYWAIESEFGEAAKYYKTLESLKEKNEIMTRLPYGIELE